MRKSSTVITLIILVAILIIVGGVLYVVRTNPSDDPQGDAVTNLKVTTDQSFTDLQGNALDFEAYEGKVRVVNAWASWNPFSIQELKDFETLASEYNKEEVVVIAINRKEPKEQAVGFLASVGTFSSIVFAIDLQDSFYTSIGGYAMPETIFYDARGNIVVHARGDMSLEEMKTYTNQALESTR